MNRRICFNLPHRNRIGVTMVLNRLKKSAVALLSASLILGSLLASSSVYASASAETPSGIVSTMSYTQIDSGYNALRTLAPGATESSKSIMEHRTPGHIN